MKLRKLIFLPVFYLLVMSCNNNDNPAPEELVFPSKVINRIVVDSSGIKWFATEKGVISYDVPNGLLIRMIKTLAKGRLQIWHLGLASGINSLLLASDVGLSVFGFGANTISFQNYNKTNSEILEDTDTAIVVDGSNVNILVRPRACRF